MNLIQCCILLNIKTEYSEIVKGSRSALCGLHTMRDKEIILEGKKGSINPLSL